MMALEGRWAVFALFITSFLLYFFPSEWALILAYTWLLSFPAYQLRQWGNTWPRKAQNALGVIGLVIASGTIAWVWSLDKENTAKIRYLALLSLIIIGGALGSLAIDNLVAWFKRERISGKEEL